MLYLSRLYLSMIPLNAIPLSVIPLNHSITAGAISIIHRQLSRHCIRASCLPDASTNA